MRSPPRAREAPHILLASVLLAGCGNEASSAPQHLPTPAPIAPAPPEPTAAPERPPSPTPEPSETRSPPSIEACSLTPVLGARIIDLVRASDGLVWTVDDQHAVRRYRLAGGEACVLALETSGGADGVLPTFADSAGAGAAHLLADEAGHVYVGSEAATERWTGTHRDYLCAERLFVVSPRGDRALVGTHGFALTDTGCSASSWALPSDLDPVFAPLAVLGSGALVVSGFSPTLSSPEAGNSCATVVAADGTARSVLYDGPNVPDHPAIAAFACGTRICMRAGASVLVLDPATMTFEPPISLAVTDEDAAGAAIASIGEGRALFAYATWRDAAQAAEPQLVRVSGLPR